MGSKFKKDTTSSMDIEKRDNSQAASRKVVAEPENKFDVGEGRLASDIEKGQSGEAAPENESGLAPELPSAFRRFFILGAVCLGIFLVINQEPTYHNPLSYY